MLLWVWSAGAILLAIFPTDVPSRPVSWHGAIHLAVAVVAFLAGALGALSIAIQMREDQAFGGIRRIAFPLAVIAVILCVIVVIAPSITPGLNSNYGGLIERLFLGTLLVWIGTVSAFLFMTGSYGETGKMS